MWPPLAPEPWLGRFSARLLSGHARTPCGRASALARGHCNNKTSKSAHFYEQWSASSIGLSYPDLSLLPPRNLGINARSAYGARLLQILLILTAYRAFGHHARRSSAWRSLTLVISDHASRSSEISQLPFQNKMGMLGNSIQIHLSGNLEATNYPTRFSRPCKRRKGRWQGYWAQTSRTRYQECRHVAVQLKAQASCTLLPARANQSPKRLMPSD